GAGVVTAAKAGIAIKIGGAVVVASAVGATAVVATSTREEAPAVPVGLVASVTPTTSAPAESPSSSAAGLRIVEAIAPSAEPSEEPTTRAPKAPPSAQKGPPASSGGAQAPTAGREDTGPEAEVRLLERAQDALRSRPAEALALADDHARRFPQGMLAQEREVIAIEALVKTGRTSDARARAARFKARFPGSSHTRRIDALVAP
ncbi:MAG: hypothetical protein KF795_32160, partial [Labilithrix sp.]|nr:hypothetical protein [Labilithrix sp.]